MLKIKIIIATLALLLFIVVILYSAKEISALEHNGRTNGNEIWQKEDNPHIIKNNFTVSWEDKLTIKEGCIIEFEKNCSLVVEGMLFAIGNEGDKINFIASSSDRYWKGIEFRNNGRGIIEYCKIKYSKEGIFANGMKNYLIINNTEISNSLSAIYLLNSSVNFSISNISSKTNISLVFENSTAILTNITAEHDISLILKKNSYITARDTKFDNILFENSKSTLKRQWHINIKIIDENNNIVPEANVYVYNEEKLIYKGESDKSGYKRYIYCTEYIQINNGIKDEKTYFSPYFIRAQKDNLKNEINVEIKDSKEITIKLEIWNREPTIQLLYPTNKNTISKDFYTLWWYGEDLDNDDLEYRLIWGRKTGENKYSLIEICDWQKNTFYKLRNLESGWTYYWKVEVLDGKIIVSSEIWEFTVKIKTYEPEIELISPLNTEVINTTSVILKWQGFDKDKDNLTYNVYFDYINASQLISENQTGTVFYLSGLTNKGTYFWRIEVSDGQNIVRSSTRSFKIKLKSNIEVKKENNISKNLKNFNISNNKIINNKNNTPPKIILLSPKNHAIILKNSVILKFNANDADGDNLKYDIYLDTKDASKLVIESYKGYECQIENLEDDKTYYWKVVAKDGKSSDTSLIWSFKVEVSENTLEKGGKENGENKIKVDKVTTAIVSTLVVSSLFAYLVFNENGRYKFLKFLAVPLYSRIKKDKVLMNDYRTKMFIYIKENPGVHLRQIMKNFGLENGAAIHHLTMLERNDYIKSMRDGSYRRYYPKDFKITKEPLDIQKKIILEISKNPGISQKEIASALNISRQVASYHIEKLKKSNKITFIKDGKVNRYYLKSADQ